MSSQTINNRGLFNRASARKCSPKFPIPATQNLASTRSAKHASGQSAVAPCQTKQYSIKWYINLNFFNSECRQRIDELKNNILIY